MYFFAIQASNPMLKDCPREARESLSSAILALFPEATEDAIMVWNWVPVRINYNADLSAMIEDVLVMLSRLLESDQGSLFTTFGANTFRADWSLRWADGLVKIDATWESVAGGYEDLLNSRGRLEVARNEFVNEWKALLEKLIEAIDRCGVSIEEEALVNQLRQVTAAISGYGLIYQGRSSTK